MNRQAWRSVSFGSLVSGELNNGLSPSTSGSVNGTVLTLSAITQGSFNPEHRKPAVFDRQPRESQLAKKGVFLICRGNGNINLVGAGRLVPAVAEAYVFPDTMIGGKLNEEMVEPRYLEAVWATHLVRSQIESGARTTNGTHKINQEVLNKIEVPLPPLEEQRRIAAILDKADAIRRKRREAIALTEELLRSTFLDMFGDLVGNPMGWPSIELGTLTVEGPKNGLYRPASDYGTGTPIIRIDSFYDGDIQDPASLRRVKIEQQVIDQYLVQAGDILINRVNSPSHLGKSALVPDLEEPTVFESNMMRFAVDRGRIDPRFLVTQLQDRWIRGQIQQKSRDAVNQSSINQSDVKSFLLRLPPLELQLKFSTLVEATHASRAKLADAQAQDEELFQSLVQGAFRGEL